jgi:arylsulfatase
MAHIPTDAAPDIRNRSYTIEVEIELEEEGSGVLIAHGDRCSGFSLYMKSGYLIHDYNLAGAHSVMRSQAPIGPGSHHVLFHFQRDGEHRGHAELRVDGEVVASLEEMATLPMVISFEGLDVGRDAMVSVTPDYESPFDFSGRLRRVRVKLEDDQGAALPGSPSAERIRQ